MDFNYDLSKNLGKEMKIRKIDEKPEEVPKENAKTEEPSQSLRIPTRRKVTADSTAINAFINRALMDGQVNKPVVTEEKEKPQRQAVNEDENNPFAKVNVAEKITVDETANNIFSGIGNENAVEKDPAVIASGGVGTVDDSYEDLVAEWYLLDFNTDTYEKKMNLMNRIIIAAKNEGNEIAAGTWTCYRFIMRNNERKEQYNNYLQQLASGVAYEDLGWNEQQWEISTSIMSPEDELDFDYFHRQLHFGGQIDPEDPMHYIQPEPEEYPQAYVYCCAMIARYSTKILAMQVKLHDPDIINYPNPNNNPENVLVWKLNQDIAYYRQLLQNMLAEKNRLAVALGYATQDENGAIHFNETFPNGDPMVGGLVPGLYPPENNPTPLTVQEQFEALKEEYFAEYGNPPQGPGDERQIEKVNTLITFASRMVGQGQSAGQGQYLEYFTGELAYWRAELLRLQNGH